jgi:TM2 domain-containing membrane protein YozV
MASDSKPECKKVVAGILALLLGGFGVHKFYLGMTTPGIIMILLACVGVSPIIALIEGIIYLTKSDEDFIREYQGENPKQWF